MRKVKFLGLLQVLQEGPAGTDRAAAVRKAGFINICKAELLADPCGAGHEFKRCGTHFRHGAQLLAQECGDVGIFRRSGREHRFAGLKTRKLVAHMLFALFGEGRTAELAGGKLAESDSGRIARKVDRADVIAALLLQHGAVGHGSGRDDADDVPLDQPFGQGGVFHLLADGDLIPLLNEFGNVSLSAVIGHPAHGGAFVRVLNVAVPRRQRQVQLTRGCHGVFIEHLVKVAQAEEEEAVGMLLFDFLILPLHWRQLSHVPLLPFRTAPMYFRR